MVYQQSRTLTVYPAVLFVGIISSIFLHRQISKHRASLSTISSPTKKEQLTTKPRSKIKKLGPVCSGNQIAQLKIPNTQRLFTVHQDLICQTSNYFKKCLQRSRKPISPTDECCICAEALDPTLYDLSFCIQCGQNIHEHCMETWIHSSRIRTPSPTCPMCRSCWRNTTIGFRITVEAELDVEAVQCYMDWIYTSQLTEIPAAVSRNSDQFSLVMLKRWAVAIAMQDSDFKAQVMTAFLAEKRIALWTESITWAFMERKCDNEIREFMIDVWLPCIGAGWFMEEGKELPEVFVRALADAAVTRWRDGRPVGSFEEVTRDWMSRNSREGDKEEDTEG